MSVTKIIAAAMSATMLITTPMTANAAAFRPLPVASADTSVEVTKVQKRRRNFKRKRGANRRRHGSRRRHNRRRDRRNDLALGILGGLIIGGIIAGSRREDEDRRRYNRYRRHVDWCYGRYRSYRQYDDTFQPYRGGRRKCYSPYG